MAEPEGWIRDPGGVGHNRMDEPDRLAKREPARGGATSSLAGSWCRNERRALAADEIPSGLV
jgi:hypothetical protein